MLKVSEILRVPPEYRILKQLTTSLTITFIFQWQGWKQDCPPPGIWQSIFPRPPGIWQSIFSRAPGICEQKFCWPPGCPGGDGQGKNWTRHKVGLTFWKYWYKERVCFWNLDGTSPLACVADHLKKLFKWSGTQASPRPKSGQVPPPPPGRLHLHYHILLDPDRENQRRAQIQQRPQYWWCNYHFGWLFQSATTTIKSFCFTLRCVCRWGSRTFRACHAHQHQATKLCKARKSDMNSKGGWFL